MSTGGNVTPIHTTAGSTGGSGSGTDERLRAVETGLAEIKTEMRHVATKADIEGRFAGLESKMEGVATKADLEEHFNRLLKWGVGILITAVGALSAIIFGLLRIFGTGGP